jgi:gas vesicle protein
MNTYIEGVRDTLARVGLVRTSRSGWLAGFAIGAGIGMVSGAVAALLVTPTNGRQMRREIGWRAKSLAERTQGAINDVAHSVKGKIQNSKLESQAERFRGREEIPVG